MAPLSPIRPPPGLLRPLLHAMALPGVGPARIRQALRVGEGRTGGGDGGPAPGRRPVVRAVDGQVVDGRGSGEQGLDERGSDERGSGEAVARLAAGLRAAIGDAEAELTDAARQRARGWAARAGETVERLGLHVLVPGMAGYPSSLRPLPSGVLFARGDPGLLERPCVAVVGTRRCTAYGREAAHRIAAGIAASGAIVVSGLARGVDGVAHAAAGPGRTVAVLGNGVDVTFPTAHRELQEAIGRDGLLLSECLPGTPPVGHNFPRRNGIIAALAAGCVVVEAPVRSGALSTAARARELGRDVFAVPGPVDSPASEGANALIRDGATLVTSAGEVLWALGLPAPPSGSEWDVPPEALHGQGLALWRALAREPRHIDEIAATVGLETHHSLASLLALEVQGHVRQLPGLRFARR